jgi:DNA ligase (NAD+)
VVQRAGDVIPEVVKVILDQRPSNTSAYLVPDNCPVCGSHVIRLPDEAKHFCQNIDCPAQVKRRIEHFASKRAMDIDGLGTKLVEQLVDEQLLGSIADIYRLEVERLSKLERMGEKSAENLVAAIDTSRRRELWRLLHALGIRNVGEHLARVLADTFHDLEGLAAASAEELEAVHEVGPIVACAVYEFFHEEHNLRMLSELDDLGVKPESPRQDTDAPLSGEVFVFTGKLEKFTRDQAREMVEAQGGTTANSVSKQVTVLVAGPGAGSKLAKAEKLGIRTLDEDDFLAWIEKN